MIEDENVVVVIAQAPIGGDAGQVSSVNAQTGDVVLDAEDVGAATVGHSHPGIVPEATIDAKDAAVKGAAVAFAIALG